MIMKKLILALFLCLFCTASFAYSYDPRFPTFTVNGMTFALTSQEDDFGMSIMLLQWDGTSWIGWGGTPDIKSTIAENITDADIMSHGSLYYFMQWVNQEAVRRALIKTPASKSC
jgi:hypothetical protein